MSPIFIIWVKKNSWTNLDKNIVYKNLYFVTTYQAKQMMWETL